MDPVYAAFLDELEKIAYGAEPSPRGNFLLASHGRVTIPLRAQSPGAARGVPMVGQEKDGDFGDYGSYNSADFKRVDINKKAAARQYANREELQQRRRDWGLDGATMSALVGALSGIPIGGVSGALARGRPGVVPGMLAGGVLGAGAGAIHGYRKGAKSIDAVLESKDFKRREERNKKASALTPAGRLASSRNQGTAAGSFQRKGPSVAEVSKLHGFGRPLAGTTKI